MENPIWFSFGELEGDEGSKIMLSSMCADSRLL